MFASGVEYVIKSPNFWHIEGFIDKSEELVHFLKPIGNKPNPATDIQYLPNYIAKYGYPKFIDLDGTEVQLTEELYNELSVNAAFIAFLSEARWIQDLKYSLVYKMVRLPDINYSSSYPSKLRFGKNCDIFAKETSSIGPNTYYCSNNTPDYGPWVSGHITTRVADYKRGIVGLVKNGHFSGDSMRKTTRIMFNGTEDSVHMIK